MKKNMDKNHYETFESIREIDQNAQEYWTARKLSTILEYSSYRNFLLIIEKAKKACKNSAYAIEDHFEDIHDIVQLGAGAKRELSDIKLSRYACYLIVQNGDPAKKVIANGQTYFALQARRQELAKEELNSLNDDEKRLLLRNELKEHNKKLVYTAKRAGVETNLDFAIFQNHGYKGLYGGLDAQSIHKHKGLKKSQQILDHMGSTELAANLFRATQTDEKLKRENIQGKIEANLAHHEVGVKVRKTIQELGGTMPENLPLPDKSAKQLEREQKKLRE